MHYHFVSKRQFEAMRDAGELLEWAEVHGNYYGTPREPVEKALAAGRDVLFDIDWQGTRQLLEKMREDVVTVFVLPPSADELKARLERRAEDSGAIIAQRLRNAIEEISHWREYDYILVNRDLDKSFCAAAGDPDRRAAQAREDARSRELRRPAAGGPEEARRLAVARPLTSRRRKQQTAASEGGASFRQDVINARQRPCGFAKPRLRARNA